MTEVFWHLGWPKTATTSMQFLCFPYLKNVEYFGKPWTSSEIEKSIMEIIYSDEVHFDSNCYEALIQHIEESKKKYTLFSNEGFLMPSANDLGITIPRILKLNYNLKIILTIRNQISLLQSFFTSAGFSYSHLMLHNTRVGYGKYLTIEQWLKANWGMSGIASNHHKSLISLLDYGPIISYIERLVGKENLYVIPYEWLSKNPEKLSNTFSKIFSCPFPKINDKESKYFQNLTTRSYYKKIPNFFARILDRIYTKVQISPPRFQVEMSDKSKNKLKDYYRKGNIMIEEKFKLNLEKLGYPL